MIEDEDAADMMDSDPGTPDASVTDGEGDSMAASPSTMFKAREHSSPDPVPRSSGKNGPKIGKRA